MSKLDLEEQDILDEVGKVRRVQDAPDTKRRHQAYAEAMFKKDARIDIRIGSRGPRGLKGKSRRSD